MLVCNERYWLTTIKGLTQCVWNCLLFNWLQMPMFGFHEICNDGY